MRADDNIPDRSSQSNDPYYAYDYDYLFVLMCDFFRNQNYPSNGH